jgi:hypothetical protein
LFSDAEELGLNGAALFATSTIGQKKWDSFFEARYFWTELHVNGNKWKWGGLLKNLLQQTLLFSIKLIDVQYL